MEAVCREALATFDGDVAQLWALAEEEAVLVHQEPPRRRMPAGHPLRSARDVTGARGVARSRSRRSPGAADGGAGRHGGAVPL